MVPASACWQQEENWVERVKAKRHAGPNLFRATCSKRNKLGIERHQISEGQGEGVPRGRWKGEGDDSQGQSRGGGVLHPLSSAGGGRGCL